MDFWDLTRFHGAIEVLVLSLKDSFRILGIFGGFFLCSSWGCSRILTGSFVDFWDLERFHGAIEALEGFFQDS